MWEVIFGPEQNIYNNAIIFFQQTLADSTITIRFIKVKRIFNKKDADNLVKYSK